MPKVSVILPLYNAEKHIEKCIRSLFVQTLLDIEFIVVDDFSSDLSVPIIHRVLSEFPERKEQIRIYRNEKNLGPGDSRLLGIKESTGDFLCFIDSDDWVEQDMYEQMYNEAIKNNADIVVCNYYNEYTGLTQKRSFYPSSSPIDCLCRLYKKGYFSYALWCQMYHRTLFNASNILETESKKYAEDLWLNIGAYIHANSICFVSNYLYHYNRTNENSLIHKREVTWEEWMIQKRDLEKVCAILLNIDKRKFKLATYWLKFSRKCEYRNCFVSENTWFSLYRETHRNILRYENLGGFFCRFKIWLIMQSLFMYRLYNRI